MLIAFLYVQAAPENFTVKPTAWKRIAVGKDVILHKTPSTSSQKLIYNFDEMVYMNPYSSARWTSGRPSDNEDYLYMDKESPILSERNGWYEIQDTELEKNVWIKASSDCWAISPDPIIAGEYCNDYFTWIDSPGDPAGGNYAIFLEPGRWANYGTIYLGRLIDGMVVCPYEISYHVDEDNNTVAFGDNEDMIFKITPSQMNDDLSLKLSRLGDRILDAIWTGSKRISKPVVIYRSPNGGSYHQTVYLEK